MTSLGRANAIFVLNIVDFYVLDMWKPTTKAPTWFSPRWVTIAIQHVAASPTSESGLLGCFSRLSNFDRVSGTSLVKGQVVNLGSAECLHIGTILHETMHALGLSAALKSSRFNLIVSTLQAPCMSTQGRTGILTFPFCWKMWSLVLRTTFRKCPTQPTMRGTRLLISRA